MFNFVSDVLGVMVDISFYPIIRVKE